MPRVDPIPYEKMDSEIQAIVRASDEALGGSEWIQYFCHPPELYKEFVKFYYSRIMTDGNGLSVKLTELVRHTVAVHNACTL
ncbi:MAG TPA: hypothetical protein VLF14_10725 [Candidatus Binatia bacterium]|nr:hypothetical protein [Candidatus Binatia bacterium]